MLAVNTIHQGDCVSLLASLSANSVDLAFADPPFNIGYDYDIYHDRHSDKAYLDWSLEWMSAVRRVLKPHGTFWLAIGDEYAAELKLLAQHELGFTCRSWVIWYYTFGVNCTKKFSRSHAHLFHFVRDPKNFTFNAFDPEVRIPSARQLVYADTRANPRGRLPDDTWILRPQDVPNGFLPDHDTTYFPRVAGTFKERAGFHGCQMPEQLLGRIIRVSSHPGDLILDPFAGSGTTLTVAKKLGRRWVGTELSPEYAKQASERVGTADAGEPLNGSAEPLRSAPATPQYLNGQSTPSRRAPNKEFPKAPPGKKDYSNLERGVVQAFLQTREGAASDWFFIDPELNAAYVDACQKLGVAGNPVSWNLLLFRLRKAGRLPHVEVTRRSDISESDRDAYSFASEIAWSNVSRKHGNISLDRIFCEAALADEFDRIARKYAPNFSSIEYRSAAFWIRKRAHTVRKNWVELGGIGLKLSSLEWKPWTGSLSSTEGGAYLLREECHRYLYAGQTANFASRFDSHAAHSQWSEFALIPSPDKRMVAQSLLIRDFKPRLNNKLLRAPDAIEDSRSICLGEPRLLG
jgi:site-specific DNA-methyltransferase (adenine-specific)